MSALNDAVGTEIAEHTGKTFSRADGDKAEGLFGRCGCGLCGVTCFELLLDGVQIVGRARLAPFCQIVVLHAHVFDLCQLQRAVFLGLGKRLPGNVRVDVDLECLVVLADDKAVADGVEIHAQRLEIDGLVLLADDIDRIVGERNILSCKVGKVRLLLRLACALPQGNVVSLQACEHAL